MLTQILLFAYSESDRACWVTVFEYPISIRIIWARTGALRSRWAATLRAQGKNWQKSMTVKAMPLALRCPCAFRGSTVMRKADCTTTTLGAMIHWWIVLRSKIQLRLRNRINLYQYTPNSVKWIDPFGLIQTQHLVNEAYSQLPLSYQLRKSTAAGIGSNNNYHIASGDTTAPAV